MSLTVILGGARSGKSSRAQSLAEGLRPQRIYIATAQALDAEMDDRIERHKAERGTGWDTIEAPLDIAAVITQSGHAERAILIDCLTLWLSNLMHAERPVEAETAALIQALNTCPSPVVLVSNEVGLGLVPATPLGRAFRDAQGRLNQDIAAVCDRVEFVVAGIPMMIKG